MGPAMRAAATPTEALAAFIAQSLTFYAAHPAEMTALHLIVTAIPAGDRDGRTEHHHETALLEGLFRRGQRDRSFRRFDPALMAVVLRGALDAAAAQVASGGDSTACARQLVQTFTRATAR